MLGPTWTAEGLGLAEASPWLIGLDAAGDFCRLSLSPGPEAAVACCGVPALGLLGAAALAADLIRPKGCAGAEGTGLPGEGPVADDGVLPGVSLDFAGERKGATGESV